MPLYRRKPTIVDAEQFSDWGAPPRGVTVGYDNAVVRFPKLVAFVTTLQGVDVPVQPGEWIVAEAGGGGQRFYPIADAEFRRLYEPVE